MSPYLATSSTTPSAIFIITSTSHIYPVASLLSSLPRSDLMLLQLAPEPLRDPNYALQNASTTPPTSSTFLTEHKDNGKTATQFVDDLLSQARDKARLVPALRSLPISPYPPPKGTCIAALVYRHPVATASSSVRQGEEEGIEWEDGMIVEYLDGEGKTSETGSYDELGRFCLHTSYQLFTTHPSLFPKLSCFEYNHPPESRLLRFPHHRHFNRSSSRCRKRESTLLWR